MKKVISLFLALTMLLSLFSGLSLTANAASTYSFSYDKESYEVGESVWVTVNCDNPNDKDWVALFAPGDPIDGTQASIAWQYVPAINGTAVDFRNDAAGALDWTNNRSNWYGFPAGTYTIVVYEDDGYNVIASSTFTINAPAVQPTVSLSVDKDSYEIGDAVSLTINAANLGASSWLGVYAPGGGSQSHGWKYLDSSVEETITLVPGNDALTWNKSDAFYAGTWSIGVYDAANQLVGEAITFTVNTPIGQPEAVFNLSLSKDGENPTYYTCQGEDPVFTINAENFGDKDWIAVHCADEVPGGSLPSIKYAYIKDINGQAINVRDDSSVWYDSPTRIGHKELPATDYTIYVCLNDGYNYVKSISFKVREHDYQAVVTEPTYTEQGYTTHTCSRCQDSYVDTFVEKLNNNAVPKAQAQPLAAEDLTIPVEGGSLKTDVGYKFVAEHNKDTIDAFAAYNKYADCPMDFVIKTDNVIAADAVTIAGFYANHSSNWVTFNTDGVSDNVRLLKDILGDEYTFTYIDIVKYVGEFYCAAKLNDASAIGTTMTVELRLFPEDEESILIDSFSYTFKEVEHNYIPAVTAPTCTERGYTTYTCSFCGDSYVDDYVDALGHNWGDWTVVTPATTTEKGQEQRICSRCQEKEYRDIDIIVPDWSISFDKESYEVGESVWVTVTGTNVGAKDWVALYAPGDTIPTTPSVAWQYMPAINGVAVDFRNDAAGALDWTNNRTEWYGFPGGTYKIVVFENDGYNVLAESSFTITEAPPSQDAVYNLSLSKDGENPTYYSCQGEDPIFTINAENFGDMDWIAVHCADEVPGGGLPSIKFAYIKDINGQAINVRESSVWSDSPTRVGHKDLPATDYTIYVCINNGYSYVKSISFQVRDHKPVALEAVAPTCTETGLTAGTKCELCNEILTAQTEVEALGHDFGDWTETTAAVPASCEAAGKTAVETRSCSRCPATETRGGEVIAALGHNFGDWTVTTPAVEATCEADGKTAVETRSCSRCTATDTQGGAVIAALGHDFGDWTIIKEASCKEAGQKQRVCKRDASHVETETIAKLDHTPVTTAGKAATCEKPGLTDKITCSVCKTVIQPATIIAPLGHNYGEWKVTKEATCVTAGEETRVCANDKNHKETREVPATGKHNYAWVVTPATTEKSGVIAHQCTVCGEPGPSFEIPISIAQIGEISLSKTVYDYDNTAKTPAVTVKNVLGEDIDTECYTISYKNNVKVGTATVTISFSGDYAGTVTKTFKINLAKPVLKVTKVSQAAVALKWTKVLGAKYYIVYEYNTKTKKYTTVAKTTGLSYTVKKLSAASTHYYLVRAYFLNKAGDPVGNPYTVKDCVKALTLTKAPVVKAKVSKKTVTLKWAKVSGTKFYRVYKYNAKTKKYSTLVKSTTKLSVTLKKQPKGNNYYLVRAFNANNEGSAYTTKNLVKAAVK